MPGVPAIDMIMFIHTWPPTEAVYKGLDKLGFIAMGDAPHYANDKLFVVSLINLKYMDKRKA